MKISIVDHALARDRLTILRDRHTGPGAFRAALHELSTMLIYEACRDLPVRPIPVETPAGSATGD